MGMKKETGLHWNHWDIMVSRHHVTVLFHSLILPFFPLFCFLPFSRSFFAHFIILSFLLFIGKFKTIPFHPPTRIFTRFICMSLWPFYFSFFDCFITFVRWNAFISHFSSLFVDFFLFISLFFPLLLSLYRIFSSHANCVIANGDIGNDCIRIMTNVLRH